MLQQTRLQRILALLESLHQISTEQLGRELNVSRETIRRDIIELEAQQKVRRVHGGIMSLSSTSEEPPFDVRLAAHAREKQAIAETCIEQLTPGQTLFIDAGSTTVHLARALAHLSGFTIITNSLQVVGALSACTDGTPMRNDVLLLGGEIEANAHETRGAAVINAISRYRADVALLSPVGISAEGASSYYQWESAIAEAMLRYSSKSLVLADSSKIGRTSRFGYAACEQINGVITDSAATQQSGYEALDAAVEEICLASV